ncbi:MAG: hypothetical protein U1E22_05430 [Coriobacteriia bacterium]|nr:hypothetical protein [Coriobacteriia bacterium]
MSRRIVMVLGLAVCVAVVAGCSGKSPTQNSSSTGGPRLESVSALVAEFSDQELMDTSRVVMRGRVIGKGTSFKVNYPSGDDRDPSREEAQLFTEWQVKPDKVYKGDGLVKPGTPVTIVLRGGMMDDLEQVWDDEASLVVGEKVLLFLSEEGAPGADTADRFWVQGFYQGKYRLTSDGSAVNHDSRKTRPLNQLESAILTP